jgi:hypothetical protein
MSTLTPDEQIALAQCFTGQQPQPADYAPLAMVSEAAKMFAEAILVSCPRSADRTAALRKVREAMMTANASIVFGGRSLS